MVGGTWILCTLSSVLALAIEAVQATPLHISQHIDAAIIISTERAAASARRERHVRRPCPTVQRLLSATLFNNSPLALPAIPIKFALFVHQSSILVNQFVLFHHQHHHHLLRPPSTQLPRSPTWLPYAHLNKHPAHLLPLSSSPLTSHHLTYHLPSHTHSLSLPTPASSALRLIQPYCAPLRTPAPEASARVLFRSHDPTNTSPPYSSSARASA